MSSRIAVGEETASELAEIGRYLQDQADGEIEHPRVTAVNMLVSGFLEEHGDKFEEKGGTHVFLKSKNE